MVLLLVVFPHPVLFVSLFFFSSSSHLDGSAALRSPEMHVPKEEERKGRGHDWGTSGGRTRQRHKDEDNDAFEKNEKVSGPPAESAQATLPKRTLGGGWHCTTTTASSCMHGDLPILAA